MARVESHHLSRSPSGSEHSIRSSVDVAVSKFSGSSHSAEELISQVAYIDFVYREHCPVGIWGQPAARIIIGDHRPLTLSRIELLAYFLGVGELLCSNQGECL